VAQRQSAVEAMVVNTGSSPTPAFWKGKRVLVTGHTGFKGSWLTYWLSLMGAEVVGLSLAPDTNPSLYQLLELGRYCESHIGDIRSADTVNDTVRRAKPDVVLHLAAQALVRAGYESPVATFSTNVMGTANVLEALREVNSCRVAVMVTTDKVYRNQEWVWPYREEDPLGGHDPYSASKAASEMAINSWRLSFLQAQGVAVASARAGNVIGGGDWSENRLIPDAVRAWQSGHTLNIRRSGAVRPWQHAIEPLAGYLVLAEHLWCSPDLAGAYNFGPFEATSVREVIELARQVFPFSKVAYDKVDAGPHEAGMLALDSSRARTVLQVTQRFSIEEAVRRTMCWYLAQKRGQCPAALCEGDIAAWMEIKCAASSLS
jgi:CDP-glucose 4,6-dehydratase